MMGIPILSHAVKSLPLSVIKMLVEVGHDITMKPNGQSLLQTAYLSRRPIDVVFYLLEQLMEKNKNIVDENITEDGCSIVHVLLGAGRMYKPTLETIKKLIQLGVNMEVENPINKWRPIHYVCFKGKYDVIEYIMGIGINLTASCFYEGTEVPPLALLDVNGNLGSQEKQFLIEQFFQFIEIQSLMENNK
jgi:ankyrin repeat protein